MCAGRRQVPLDSFRLVALRLPTGCSELLAFAESFFPPSGSWFPGRSTLSLGFGAFRASPPAQLVSCPNRTSRCAQSALRLSQGPRLSLLIITRWSHHAFPQRKQSSPGHFSPFDKGQKKKKETKERKNQLFCKSRKFHFFHLTFFSPQLLENSVCKEKERGKNIV
jgi:hypothetical protein